METTRDIFGEPQSNLPLKERLAAYTSNWPLFLACIFLFAAAGFFYTRYTPPKYTASTSFLIKSQETGTQKTVDLIEATLNGKKETNVNNEMLMISSSSLMERTVRKNNFNIQYYHKGTIINDEIDGYAPFELSTSPEAVIKQVYNFSVTVLDAKGGIIRYGPEKASVIFPFVWNKPVVINWLTCTFSPKNKTVEPNTEYLVSIQPIAKAAAALSASLTIKPFDTRTNAITLLLKSGNQQRGVDILNGLVREFTESDIEDRNRIADTTVSFINDRLIGITNELKSVEGNLEDYQGSRRLSDVKGQSAQSLENASDVSKTIKNINIQQEIAGMITQYFSNPANNSKLVPSSLGLSDPTLTSLIAQYNELQLKKERELPVNAPNSIVIQDINTQIASLRSSVLESLVNINKNLNLQEGNFQQQNSKYNSFLNALPHTERALQEIKRKQNVTEGLYLYLLQKREEAAISHTASNIPLYKQIDPAKDSGITEPSKRSIIFYAALFGFFIAALIIYSKDLLTDTINTKEDIIRKLSLPIVGEISHIHKKDKQPLLVLGRSLPGEEFRLMRAKLFNLLKDKTQQVILVTSSLGSEGKSFISLNLAAVCAMPGKKVAFLEFDLRKPTAGILADSQPGLTDFLTGGATDIATICIPSPDIASLDIFHPGKFPENPADVFLSGKLESLLDDLRKQYDFIVLDSPPIGLVSDAFMLARQADAVLYIIRQGQTPKKQLNFVEEAVRSGGLPSPLLVLNDTRKKKGGYYYGYGA